MFQQQQQPSPDEQRNLLIAGVLCVAVILLWNIFVIEPAAERQRAAAEAERIRLEEARGGPDAPVGAGGPLGAQPLDVAAALERSPRIKIETPNVEGSLALTGARIDELKLKTYRTEVDPESPLVELLWPADTAQSYFAFFGWTGAGGVSTPNFSTEWTLAPGSPSELTPGNPVVLFWDNGAGLRFTRTIAVDDGFLFTVKQSVENSSGAAVRLRPISQVERHGRPQVDDLWILHEGPVAVFDGELNFLDYDDIAEGSRLDGGWRGQSFEVQQNGWLGFTDKYWMTALAPASGRPFTAVFDTYTNAFGAPINRARAFYGTQTLAAGESIEITTRFFAGAKEISTLRAYQYVLDGVEAPTGFFGRLVDFFFYGSSSRFIDAIDWGWFFFLTKPIFEVLAALNGLVGNMGVAIITLTLIVKTLLLPLAYKSYVSMSKLKKLQPEMKRIQESAGDDKMKMQQEMMALYKKERVNPASGCFPILLQIPIFFSLYKVLSVSIEMRHAPFFGWIEDLSAADPTSIINFFGLLPWDHPYFLPLIGIWPVIMGVSMWVQMQLNPAPTDPVQEKIFLLLPFVFTIMLGTFASGLVIYWTANNIFTIIQQYSIMRSQGVEVELMSNIKKRLGLAPKEESG